MNKTVLSWGRKFLTKADVDGKRILEVGSYDINGTIRDVIVPLLPAEYIGADIRTGPCVDVICDVCNLVEEFGQDSFDMVIACSVLSHVTNWRDAISNIKRVCKPGGIIFVVTVSRWKYRTYGNDYHDYWRFSRSDLQRVFSDCTILALREQAPTGCSLICVAARKPAAFKEIDLAAHNLTGAKSQSRRWGHIHYARSHPV